MADSEPEGFKNENPGYSSDEDSVRFHSPLVSDHEDDVDAIAENSNNDRIPLIPTDFTTIEEAMQNFTAVFESRYGVTHPIFYQTDLQQAVIEAFDAPGFDVMERKPLVIYLHNDNAIGSHIFAQTVLCSESIGNLLQKQFVVWAWDMTQSANRTKLYEWMSASNLTEVHDAIKLVPAEKYPLLVVTIRERGKIVPMSLSFGQDDCTQVLERLMMGLDTYQPIKSRDADEEKDRIEREQFRQEQVDEYNRALASDRVKLQERQEQAKRELEAEQHLADKKSRLFIMKEQIREQLPPEPDADSQDEVVRVRVSFPDGASFERRFLVTDSLETLFSAVFVRDECPEDFSLLSSYPRRAINAAPDWYSEFGTVLKPRAGTFLEEGLHGSVAVLVRNNNA